MPVSARRCYLYIPLGSDTMSTKYIEIWKRWAKLYTLCLGKYIISGFEWRLNQVLTFYRAQVISTLTHTEILTMVIFIPLKVRQAQEKAVWWILFWERSFFHILSSAQLPLYANSSSERNAKLWLTLKTRILKQDFKQRSSLWESFRRSPLSRATFNRSRLLSTWRVNARRAQFTRRLNSFGLTVFWR